MREEAKYWIDRLGLVRHPEGRILPETYRSEEMIADVALPGRYGGWRKGRFQPPSVFSGSGDDFSALHRLRSDGDMAFLAGEPLYVLKLEENGGICAPPTEAPVKTAGCFSW